MDESGTLPLVSPGRLPLRGLKIEVVAGPDKGLQRTARTDTLTVGTARDNDVVLRDETVSRYHLELKRSGDRISVADLGSTNSTAVGPVLIERARVSPGTILTLGETQLRIQDSEMVNIELFGADSLGPLRGRSPNMRELMARIQKTAASDASVLLLGETGVGKEVIARAFHEASPRRDGPFETVDCGALLPTLIGSELFGHEKGAFTGAHQRHLGAFERAHGGTLFLDEIGELPPSLQPMLLGALERRVFRRLGGTTSIEVDIRLISATHRDLRADVNAGQFRQDLYYRLAVVLMRVPALRERPADIPLLAEHFLRQHDYRGPVEDLLPAPVMRTLAAHRWPGNVRELRNFVEAALAVGEAPELEDIAPASGDRGSGTFPSQPLPMLLLRPYKDARALVLDELEAAYVQALLERNDGNISKAARDSGISRQHFMELLKRHGRG